MNKILKDITPVRIVFILLSVICMAVIFMFSMEDSDESSERSGTITEIAIEVFAPDFEELTVSQQTDIISSMDHIVRKIAHFSIYMLLGFLISCAAGKRRLLSAGTPVSLVICFIYACSDELHQYFVPGRSCQFTDVLIDASGSMCGIILSMLCMYLLSRIKNKSSP